MSAFAGTFRSLRYRWCEAGLVQGLDGQKARFDESLGFPELRGHPPDENICLYIN